MAEWEVLLLRPARRYLSRLSRPDQERVLDALSALQEDPFKGDVRPLRGHPGRWRLRIGSYRAVLRVDRDRYTIVVTSIGPRGDSYKGG